VAARGMPFSISAAIGFIALFGISVLNGVVLLTTIKAAARSRSGSARSCTKGAESRLRAVTMTATVAALGFIPMALSSSAGAEVQRPLATVVIGGLVTRPS
jgi:cobalt-zinc-cadmium resistance protein CzcA